MLRDAAKEQESVILSLRAQGAAARGTSIGMSSDSATALARSVHRQRERAVGRKAIRNVEDPERVRQVHFLLAEQNDMIARHLPNPHHQYRPDGMSIEQWRD